MPNRRTFLRQSTKAAVAALLFPHWACSSEGQTGSADSRQTEEGSRIAKYGIQLWTLRDIIGEDPKGVIKALSEFGYKQIESYEGDQGIFWGMSPKEYKSYLDGLGLEAVSSHCDINKDFEAKAQQAAEIGMKYLICPWVGPQESMDDFKRIADQFNECGAICKKHGLRFAYHNHAYSFKELDGQIPHDYMMDNTDADLVDYEMDIYWVVTAGADPVAYLNKYPGRFKLSHVKDRLKDAPADERQASCVLGKGQIDYPPILTVAKKQGMEYFLVEQERYDSCTPLDCAKEDAEYLEGIRI